MRSLLLFLALFVFSATLCSAESGAASDEVDYICRRTTVPPVIDGKPDEPAWRNATRSPVFTDIVDGGPAFLRTQAALLWDDHALYATMWVEEPFVQAELRERDAPVYRENDLEIFIAGADAYYEFGINALGTVYDVFWIWRDALRPGSPYTAPRWNPKGRRTMTLSGIGDHVHPRGERLGFIDWDCPGLRAAVSVQGTVNDNSDRDQGWTLEVAFPWGGLADIADGRSLPPVDGDEWRIDCSRFQHYDGNGRLLSGPNRIYPKGWVWKPHGAFDSHMPETFPRIRFESDEDQRSGASSGSSGG